MSEEEYKHDVKNHSDTKTVPHSIPKEPPRVKHEKKLQKEKEQEQDVLELSKSGGHHGNLKK